MRDMTKGSIGKHLISYALPMIAGNIMQLTYNAADSVIIGKNLGKDALAAVSTSGPVMTVAVLGASGMGIGASVLMSRLKGAGDREGLKKEFSTALLFGFVFSLCVFLAGFLFAGSVLRLINTPEESFRYACTYLRTVLVGFLFTFQYNILSNSLRALGDSKTPVLILFFTCLLNIAVDLLLVKVFRAGVLGAGLATVFAQAVSVLLCAVYIAKKVPELRLARGDWRIDRKMLAETLKIGGISALQQTAQPVGKVLIQSVINSGGVVAVDAFNTVCRVDDFACIPAQSIGSGIMTCSAQNRGAGSRSRVRETLKNGLLLGLCWFPVICLLTLLLKGPVSALLAPAAEEGADTVELILTESEKYLSVKAFFFIMPCILNAMQGFLRGMGRMTAVLCGTVIQISLRAVFTAVLFPEMGITGEAWACLIGWSCQLLFTGTLLLVLLKRGREAPEPYGKREV